VTLSDHTISIFILEGDPVTARSQKCLLETHDHTVRILDFKNLIEHTSMQNHDIMLLDIAAENPTNFPVLNQFLKAQIRPKLLITAYENQVFQKDDFLGDGAAQILFKPFSPSDLLDAVTELTMTPHG